MTRFDKAGPTTRSTKYRLQFECKECQVLWDTGRIREDDGFFNS